MADAPASGAGARKGVGVQIPSSAPVVSGYRVGRWKYVAATAPRIVPRWRNWYTRTFEGRMEQSIRVQVPAWAPPLFLIRNGGAAASRPSRRCGRLAQR